MAFVGSLLLGLILAVIVEQVMDNRVRTAEQVDRKWALAADERALMLMSVAMVALSVAALLAQV